MSTLPGSELHRWDQSIDDQLKAEVKDCNDDEASHDGHFQIDRSVKLVNLIVVAHPV